MILRCTKKSIIFKCQLIKWINLQKISKIVQEYPKLMKFIKEEKKRTAMSVTWWEAEYRERGRSNAAEPHTEPHETLCVFV